MQKGYVAGEVGGAQQEEWNTFRGKLWGGGGQRNGPGQRKVWNIIRGSEVPRSLKYGYQKLGEPLSLKF